MAAEDPLPGEAISIFEVYDASTKSRVLLVGSLLALLTPFTDTVYLPALPSVEKDLHASANDVAATVSC
jgi:hypothetical protein